MLYNYEIPNSQPSSPGLSLDGSNDDTNVIEANSNEPKSGPDTNAELTESTAETQNRHTAAFTQTETAASQDAQSDSEAKDISTHNPSPEVPSTLSTPAPYSTATSPHKPLATAIRKSMASNSTLDTTPYTARKAAQQSHHSPEYLRQRISILASSLDSTHTQLVSTLDELATQIPWQDPNPNGAYSNTTTQYTDTARDQQELTIPQKETLTNAAGILRSHVALLGKYNKVKDIATGMLGIIAERERRTVRDVMRERGIEEGE